MTLPQTPLRDVNHSRISDITLAYIASRTKGATVLREAHALFLKNMESADKKFRDIIDQNNPLLYVIDCNEIAEIIYDELKQEIVSRKETLKDYTYTWSEGGKAAKYFVKLEKSDEKVIFSGDKDFYSEFMSRVLNDTFKTTLADKLYAELNSKIENSVDETQVNTQLDTLYKEYINKAAILHSIKSEYINYTELAVAYTTKFKNIVFSGKKAVKFKKAVATNKNTITVLADSFTYFRDTYNPILTKAALEVFKARGASPYEKTSKEGTVFSIGEFIDIGHTAAFITGDSPIGVNMPAAQAAFTAISVQQGQKLETELSALYSDLEVTVDFEKDFEPTGRAFINFGVAVAVVMRKPVNSTLLRTVENRIIAPYKQKVKQRVLESLRSPEYIAFLAAQLPVSKSSKNLIQFIVQAVVNPLESTLGRKDKLTKETGNKPIVKNLSINIAPKLQIKGSNFKKSKGGGGTSKINIPVKKSQKSNINVPVPNNIIGLQKLLDANLTQTIKQNMGMGNRRDILNLRSGRFAESVQVNSISESRQGMITAFYSYMRNPYATFSQGGRQQYPRTRDPKLLISNSIRQLAKQLMIEKLRVVQV